MSTTNWMSNLTDKKWLRQIVMPGSHDAGVYGTAKTVLRNNRFVKNSYVVCQHSDFSKQALAGSRFFDCRVFQQKVAPGQYEQKLGHFAMERKKSSTPAMGGYGGALEAVLRSAFEFVLGHPSEFVILRFSHTYHPDACVQEIYQIIQGDQRFGQATYKETGNIATKPISSLRGKVIMVFDEKFNKKITPTAGVHRFKKFETGLEQIDGLATCGKFSRSMSMSKVHDGAIDAMNKHINTHQGQPGHLHFVYWQQTAGLFGEKDIYKTTTKASNPNAAYSGGASQHIGDFAAEIKNNIKGATMPVNVISHDFVTSETCLPIIRLNPECAGI